MPEIENIEQEEPEISPQQELEEMLQDIQDEERLFDKKTKEFLKRHRKGEKIPMEEQDLHTQHRKLINQLQKSYDSLYKSVYPKGTKNKTSNAAIIPMQAVKNIPSSIGNIVTTIPTNLQGEKEANG